MYGNFVHATNDASHYTKPPTSAMHSSLYCKTIDTGLVHHVVCLFTYQLELVPVLIVPTHEWMAGRVDLSG